MFWSYRPSSDSKISNLLRAYSRNPMIQSTVHHHQNYPELIKKVDCKEVITFVPFTS
jgi:hypothetical protein